VVVSSARYGRDHEIRNVILRSVIMAGRDVGAKNIDFVTRSGINTVLHGISDPAFSQSSFSHGMRSKVISISGKARRSLAMAATVAMVGGIVLGATPTASAAEVAYRTHCVNQIVKQMVIPDSDIAMELSVSPVKDVHPVGEPIEVTWTWKKNSPVPDTGLLPKVDKDSTKPSGIVKLSGPENADLELTGLRINDETLVGDELKLASMTGRFTPSTAGTFELTPGNYSTLTFARDFGVDALTLCNPVNPVAVSTSFVVEGETSTQDPTLSVAGSPQDPGGTFSFTGENWLRAPRPQTCARRTSSRAPRSGSSRAARRSWTEH